MFTKNKKKIAILLAAAILGSLCGCEKENYYEKDNNNSNYGDSSELKKVVFESEEKSVKLGTQTQLEYILVPAGGIVKSCTFESSDETVVSVDDTGKITALKKGTAVIKGTFNEGVVCECTVTVEDLPNAVITCDAPSEAYTNDTYEASVALNGFTSGMIKVVCGGVTGSVTKEDEVTNLNDESNTAYIVGNDFRFNFTVTAKSGECFVSVFCYDNGELIDMYEKSIEVLSDKLQVFPSQITVSEGDTVSLGCSDTDGITWSSSDKSVATVSGGGVVTAKKAGTAKITASNGKSKGSITITVTEKSADETSVTE